MTQLSPETRVLNFGIFLVCCHDLESIMDDTQFEMEEKNVSWTAFLGEYMEMNDAT